MRVIYLDANAYDKLVADLSIQRIMGIEQKEGKLQIISSYITEEELARAPEPKRKRMLQLLELTEDKPTAVAVFPLPLGRIRLGSREYSEIYENIKGLNPKNVKDAIVAATAIYENADYLVTDDKRFSRRFNMVSRSRGKKTRAIDWNNFVSSSSTYREHGRKAQNA